LDGHEAGVSDAPDRLDMGPAPAGVPGVVQTDAGDWIMASPQWPGSAPYVLDRARSNLPPGRGFGDLETGHAVYVFRP